MSKKPKILFIHIVDSSFVQEDFKILGKFLDYKPFFFKSEKSGSKLLSFFKLLATFFRQFVWLCWKVKSAKAIYCWFSDYHGFLPAVFARLFNKPMITVLGGFDCIKMPHMNYGIFLSRWRRWMGTFVVRNSTILLPVNKTLIETDPIAKNWPDAHPNGLKFNVKNFNTPWREVATGYAVDFWQKGPLKRGKKVCMVAGSPYLIKAVRKGIDLFIETAKILPDFTFTVVGLSEHVKNQIIEAYRPGDNVIFLPKQERRNLNKIYADSSVYLQLSKAEGLPNVLCEAMMCGCVPVGSAVFGIPHGIGEAGYVAEKPDPKEAARLIQLAHKNAEELRAKARQRIIDNFSLERREESLREVFRELGVFN